MSNLWIIAILALTSIMQLDYTMDYGQSIYWYKEGEVNYKVSTPNKNSPKKI
jgi:uncharacterized membrane protein